MIDKAFSTTFKLAEELSKLDGDQLYDLVQRLRREAPKIRDLDERGMVIVLSDMIERCYEDEEES